MQSLKSRGRDGDHNVNEVFGRLRTVEGEVGNLRADVREVAANQNSLAASVQSIVDKLDRIDTKSATDWKALAAWAAVILTLVGLYTSQNLNPLKEQTQLNTAAISRALDREASRASQEVAAAEEQGRYRERVDNIERQQRLLMERELLGREVRR